MDTTLEYYDLPGYTVYGMIFSTGNAGLTNTTNVFATYTDAAATGFAHAFGADVNRANRYTLNLGPFNAVLTEGAYEIAIFTQNGAEPDTSADNLKLVDHFYWSSGLVENLVSPNLETMDFIGNIEYNNTFAWLAHTENEFGSVCEVDNNLDYIIKENGATTIATGTMSLLERGLYYDVATASGSLFDTDKTYQIIMTAHINSIPVKTMTCFTVSSGSTSITGYPDLLDLLGYVTGSVTINRTTSGFDTNLTSSVSRHYNGGILRLTSGTLRGQARIISAYNTITKRVDVNKPFSSVPASGSTFVIFPIGGELNNT